MPNAMRCQAGHEWQLAESPMPDGATCPVCGEEPVQPSPLAEPWSMGAKAWLIWWLFWTAFTVGTLVLYLSTGGEFTLFVMIGSLVTGAILGAIWAVWLKERRRMFAMKETCQFMGFVFTERINQKEIRVRCGPAPLFQLGHSQKAYNLMEGHVAGSDLILMDYRYVVGSGKHQQTHQQTVVLLPHGGSHLPSFQLFPESFFQKIGNLFGYQHIKFPENKQFSERYQLRGPNEGAIRRAFSPQVLDWFAGQPGWSVQAQEGWLLVFRSGTRIKPDQCPERIAAALQIQALFTLADHSEPEASEE